MSAEIKTPKKVPEWVYEQTAIDLSVKYRRLFTIQEVKDSMWVMRTKKGYFKLWGHIKP